MCLSLFLRDADKPKQRLSTDWSSSQTELSSDMKLVWSDDDDVTVCSFNVKERC